jgi:hypothetical protein
VKNPRHQHQKHAGYHQYHIERKYREPDRTFDRRTIDWQRDAFEVARGSEEKHRQTEYEYGEAYHL